MSSPEPVALARSTRKFLRPLGVALPEGLSFGEWEELGEYIRMVEGGLQWWLGDWMNYGERAYGEQYAQAIDVTGREYQTLANAAWVAGRIEFSRRRENLSWSHHSEVAALEPLVADELLDLATAEGWSKSELRDVARTRKRFIAAQKQATRLLARPGATQDRNGHPASPPVASAAPRASEGQPEPILGSGPFRGGARETVRWTDAATPDPQRLLSDIRIALGCETNDQILPAIRSLLAARVAVEPPKKKAAVRGWKFCPKDWEPSQKHRDLALELRVPIERELVAFREWEFKELKTDADRAFFRWLRKAAEMAAQNGHPPQKPTTYAKLIGRTDL